jgi:hypothetical protein
MYFEVSTFVLCTLGWITHWLMSWGEEWKASRMTIWEYILENPPGFLVSAASTLLLYLLGPDMLAFFEFAIPDEVAAKAEFLKLFCAAAVGYMGDSLFYKLTTLFKKS